MIEQEQLNELCAAYPPLGKIVELVGASEPNYWTYKVGEFLIELTRDLQEAGALPAREAPAVEIPDANTAI